MLTNVIEPQRLSIRDALSLYPWRWKGALVFDLKEVLNLHRFYTGSPNGVAMQVYAAALVHTAFRVAQGHIAQASGTQPGRRDFTGQVFPAWLQQLLLD